MRKNTILLIIWSLIMCWATLSPADSLPRSGLFDIPYFDKIAHFGLFLIFSFLLTGVLNHVKKAKTKWFELFISAIFITLAFSLFIEFGQKYVPGRNFDYFDIVFNVIGATFGFLLFIWKLKFIGKAN